VQTSVCNVATLKRLGKVIGKKIKIKDFITFVDKMSFRKSDEP
jgi:hypothetical protein